MSESSIKRVGLLFSGGPAPAANAVISAAAMTCLNAGVSVLGFYDGFENLEQWSEARPLEEGRHYCRITKNDVTGIRNRGDIMIRTARANPGKPIASLDDLSDSEKNAKLRNVFGAFQQCDVDALISIGGDDTLKTANYLYEIQRAVPGLKPVKVIHVPKTIDNDYNGIDWTFGFLTASNFAAREIRNIGNDAKSTSVWWMLEVMGRKAGWLTYASGIAGEATKMISVEDYPGEIDLPSMAEDIVDLIIARAKECRDYGVVCVAEGLADKLPADQRPEETDEHGNTVLAAAAIGKTLAGAVEKAYQTRTGKKLKVRHKQIGYETRCAEPTAFDVLLATQLGVGAARGLIENGQSGVMVSVEGQLQLKYVPFGDLIDPDTLRTRVRFIETDSDFYRLARALEYQESAPPDEICEP
jgi:6-phosphofructokinase 1